MPAAEAAEVEPSDRICLLTAGHVSIRKGTEGARLGVSLSHVLIGLWGTVVLDLASVVGG